jgi:hypothetical protein
MMAWQFFTPAVGKLCAMGVIIPTKCPFCNAKLNSEREVGIDQMKKRVEANDVNALTGLGCCYFSGSHGLRQDWNAAFKLIEYISGNVERAVKHWMISASAGHDRSMTAIQEEFEEGLIQSDAYELTLKAYDDSLAEMGSQVRDDAAALKRVPRV